MKPRLVLIDDDPATGLAVTSFFRSSYDVIWLLEGSEAVERILREPADLVLLDINLPGPNGLLVLNDLHSSFPSLPIIMLSIRNEDSVIIQSFGSGAVEYVPKPFSLPVLRARIDRWFSQKGMTKQLRLGDREIDFDRGTIRNGAEETPLTDREAKVLWFLWANVNCVLKRNRLLDYAWGCDYEGTPRTLDTLVTRLRKKLGWDERQSWKLESVYSAGYRLVIL